MALPWISFDASTQALANQRRYYALLFEHEFAQAFWREGTNMTFVVPNSTFERVSKDGTLKVVKRRGHTRRAVKPDAWLYHLKAMAATDEPLRYIRKFLLIEEDLTGIQSVSDEEHAPSQVSVSSENTFKEDLEEDFDWGE